MGSLDMIKFSGSGVLPWTLLGCSVGCFSILLLWDVLK